MFVPIQQSSKGPFLGEFKVFYKNEKQFYKNLSKFIIFAQMERTQNLEFWLILGLNLPPEKQKYCLNQNICKKQIFRTIK